MASNYSSLQASALLWSMASLGNSGNGGGGPGTPGKDGNNWIVVNEPLTDGFTAPLGSKANDLVLDSTGEIFRVINDSGNLVVVSTGVTLSPTVDQKSLYQLYLDLSPTTPLTEAQFKTRFLEALEEHEDFNLFEFYKTSGGLKYTTEADFNDQFIKLMDFDLDSIVTDRIISKDGKNHVISDNDGIDALGEKIQIKSNNNLNIEAKDTTLTSETIAISATGDTTDGSLTIQGLKDPVADLDAVNKRTLDKAVSDLEDKIDTVQSDLEDKIKAVDDKVDALDKREADHYVNVLDLINKLNDKHNEDINNLITTINTKFTELKDEISDYLTDQLPGMIEAEVKKQLADINPGGCDWDVVDGNVWPETDKEVLTFDNGNATSTNFDYVMLDYDDPAIDGDMFRIADGNVDSNTTNTMSFQEWLEVKNLTIIYDSGDANTKDELFQRYLYDGGSATSKW